MILLWIGGVLAEEHPVLVQHPDVVVNDVETQVFAAMVMTDSHLYKPSPVAQRNSAVRVDQDVSTPW